MNNQFALAPPGALDGPTDHWIHRRAKLFEAGEYSDKGISVTREGVSVLASNFGEKVPVWIEHAESPLELGYLISLEPDGDELFGTIALTPEANALVERSGAKSLSVGLSADLTRIREVSLVKQPRIADAQLFSENPNVCKPEFRLLDRSEIDWKAHAMALERRALETESDRKVDEWVSAGRLTPAQSRFAKAILRVNDVVEFDGESRPVSQLLVAMVQGQPPLGLFSELAPAAAGNAPPTMTPEESDFYRKYFPDVPLERISGQTPLI